MHCACRHPYSDLKGTLGRAVSSQGPLGLVPPAASGAALLEDTALDLLTGGFIEPCYRGPPVTNCPAYLMIAHKGLRGGGGRPRKAVVLSLWGGGDSLIAAVAPQTHLSGRARECWQRGDILKVGRVNAIGPVGVPKGLTATCPQRMALLIHSAAPAGAAPPTLLGRASGIKLRAAHQGQGSSSSAEAGSSAGAGASGYSVETPSQKKPAPRSTPPSVSAAEQAAGQPPIVVQPLGDMCPQAPNTPVRCSGGHCTGHGMIFHRCMLEQLDFPSVADVAETCWGADEEVEHFTSSDKRYLMYWWFAATIYAVTKAGCRVQVPVCVEAKIRSLYPNLPGGGEYKGFSLE